MYICIYVYACQYITLYVDECVKLGVCLQSRRRGLWGDGVEGKTGVILCNKVHCSVEQLDAIVLRRGGETVARGKRREEEETHAH